MKGMPMGIKSEILLALIISSLSGEACLAAPFEKTLDLQGVTFKLSAPESGSLTPVIIDIVGLEGGPQQIKREVEGSITGAEIADLNSDGSPEIYIYSTSVGSGSYGSVTAWATNKKKSFSEIFLVPLTENKKLSKGYMGHDEFSIVEQYLVRRFPVYRPGDANSQPTGGLRQVQYKLVNGEASWLLRPVKSLSFK